MDSKQYFKSPIPRYLEYDSFPIQKFRLEDEQLFEKKLFTPKGEEFRSPYSAFSHVRVDFAGKNKDDDYDESQFGRITTKINLLDEQISEESQKIEQMNIKTIVKAVGSEKKKYQLRNGEKYKKPYYGKDTSRGLRALSKQCYDILNHSIGLKYQQVAQKIIEQNDQINQCSQKECQSIKRRVYDSLNVLIALEILTKNNKIISLHPLYAEKIKAIKKNKLKFKQQILLKQNIICQKRNMQKKLFYLINEIQKNNSLKCSKTTSERKMTNFQNSPLQKHQPHAIYIQQEYFPNPKTFQQQQLH